MVQRTDPRQNHGTTDDATKIEEIQVALDDEQQAEVERATKVLRIRRTSAQRTQGGGGLGAVENLAAGHLQGHPSQPFELCCVCTNAEMNMHINSLKVTFLVSLGHCLMCCEPICSAQILLIVSSCACAHVGCFWPMHVHVHEHLTSKTFCKAIQHGNALG